MTHFIKVTAYKRNPGGEREMLYQDNNAEWFIGPRHNVIIGTTYVVEITDVTKDGYRQIDKFTSALTNK